MSSKFRAATASKQEQKELSLTHLIMLPFISMHFSIPQLLLHNIEVYFEPCRTSMIDPFAKIRLKDVNYFPKKLHRRCSTGF